MSSRVAAAVAGAVLGVLAVYVLYAIRHALLIIYIATLLAILFDPAVRLVRRLSIGRYRPGRGVATAIVTLATAGLLFLIGLLVVPPIVTDASRLANGWPERSARLFATLHRDVPFTQSITADTIARWLRSSSGTSPVIRAGTSVVTVLTTLLLAIYLLADGHHTIDWALTFVPARHRVRLGEALDAAARRTQHWVAGQGILMLTHGGSAFITFWAIGLPYFTTLAVFAAIINVIPVLGPVLTLGAAGLVAATSSPGKLLAVVIFYLVYHNVEGAFLQPRIMQATVGIPGAAVVAALIIGDEVAGFVGMAFSVPTAVLIAELKCWYVDRQTAD